MFNHLQKINQNYLYHMKDALYISYIMALGSFQALIHAFYPDVYETGASSKCRMIIDLVDKKIILPHNESQ